MLASGDPGSESGLNNQSSAKEENTPAGLGEMRDDSFAFVISMADISREAMRYGDNQAHAEDDPTPYYN